MYKNIVKRVIDVTLSLIGLIVLLPLFVVVGLMIYIDDPGPVLFKQQRVGKDKKPFTMHKFRSMRVNTPEIPGYLFDNSNSYITRVGRFIRRYSIDELPQLYDIFIGKMSIIGYRPAAYINEDELNTERDKHNVCRAKPGLSGLAQINGRDVLTIETKVAYDTEYVEILDRGGFKAFATDVKCFFGTIVKVLKKEGIVEGRRKTETEKEKEVVMR